MNFHQIVSDTMQRVHEEKNDQPLIGEKQIFNYLKIVCNKMIRLDIVEKFLALELFFCKSVSTKQFRHSSHFSVKLILGEILNPPWQFFILGKVLNNLKIAQFRIN